MMIRFPLRIIVVQLLLWSVSRDFLDSHAGAQPLDPPTNSQAEVAKPSEPPVLATQQKSVAERFSRLESLLLRSADLEAGENPTRAALLQQAVQLSKQAALAELLADAAARLDQGQFSEAIDKQKQGRENLKRLLELLQSENREERIREQRDEVRRWIEETDRLLRLQSSLRGRTEGGQDASQSAQDQGKLSKKAEEIAGELGSGSEKNDEPTTGPAEKAEAPKGEANKDSAEADRGNAEDSSQPAEPSSNKAPAEGDQPPEGSSANDSAPNPQERDSNGQSKDGTQEAAGKKDSPAQDADSANRESSQPNSRDNKGRPLEGTGDGKQTPDGSQQQGAESQDSKSSQGQSQQGQSQQGQSQQGQSQQGQSQQGQSQQGQSQQGQSQQGQSQQDNAPEKPKSPTERAKQRIEEAQQKMQEAQKQLENAEREGAIEKQREAEEQLREAIEELEEILRQLREEEVERSLASLETRLRRMLELQTKVVAETTRLQEITGDSAVRQVQISAGKLALDERSILAEGERAFLLLREEGSSAAFPEAMEQLNSDISSVVERLSAGDVGTLTLTIEQEIVSSLEEMVEALVQVQKENREKQQQQRKPQQQGEPGDKPLVDKLAELRLIRTLQIRINKRTGTLSKLLSDPSDPTGQAQEADILNQLKDLSGRQSSIQNVTRDIVVGKGE